MKVEVFKRQTIKPSSPTPHHLRFFKLCFMDQHAAAMYSSKVLFYPNITDGFTDHDANSIAAAERSQLLKRTLSETLTYFYPLAGRIRGNLYVECNDEGAEFLETRVNCSMSRILENPDSEMIKKFLPIDVGSEQALTGPLALVQANFFECGGMAIGLSLSHKLVDASSRTAFIKCWSAVALGSNEALVLPEFGAASLFPPIEYLEGLSPFKLFRKKCSTRRFVFDASKIVALQKKAASESVKKATRVEAVSTLIWKCAMEASRANKGDYLRASTLCQCVNIRPRILPALPESFFGNIIDFFAVKVEGSETKDVQDLVTMLRKGMNGFKEGYGKGFDRDKVIGNLKEIVKLTRVDEIDNYNFTSWCRFPIYDAADFGWGKPRWVSIASAEHKNVVYLLDKRDGNGIEAWLVLEEEDMALVERNQELLAFATLNPSVV